MSNKSKNHEDFINEVNIKLGNKYTILDKYINTTTYINVRHNICGYEWTILPYNIFKLKTCPNCFGNLRKNTEQFKKEVYQLVKNEYDILENYIKSNIRIKIKHNKCDNIFEMTPNNFLRGQRCPVCQRKESNKKRTKTHEQFINEVYELVGNEYIVLENYITTSKKILFKHNIEECGNEFKITPNKFLSKGSRCPICSEKERIKKRTKTHEQFIQDVYDLVGDEYTVLEKYIKSNIKILFRHNFCGNEFKMSPQCFLSNQRCPKCSLNKGKKHYNWKGGISSLHSHLRRFLIQWKYDSMKNCNYKCIITGKRFEDIHHIYPFFKIIDETLLITKIKLYESISNYTNEELKLIENMCLELHYKYGLGVCLTKELHKEFHKIYTEINFTPENFQEFYFRKTGKQYNINWEMVG